MFKKKDDTLLHKNIKQFWEFKLFLKYLFERNKNFKNYFIVPKIDCKNLKKENFRFNVFITNTVFLLIRKRDRGVLQRSRKNAEKMIIMLKTLRDAFSNQRNHCNKKYRNKSILKTLKFTFSY